MRSPRRIRRGRIEAYLDYEIKRLEEMVLHGEFVVAALKRGICLRNYERTLRSPRRIRRGRIEAIPRHRLLHYHQTVLHGEFVVAALKRGLQDIIDVRDGLFSTANSSWPH